MQGTQPTTAGQAAATPPALKPVMHVPLHVDPDGTLQYPTIEFDSAHSRIYVVQPVQHAGLWGWVNWHAPTLAGATLLLTLLVLTIILRQYLKRPQVFGQFYCTRCNYDLTAPGGMPPETLLTGAPGRCPECGVDLLVRRPRVARALLARAWKPVVGALTLMVACVAIMCATLEAFTPTFGRPPWLPLLKDMPGFPRLQRIRDWNSPEEQRVTWQELPAGKRGTFLLASGVYGQVTMSPDAKWLTVTNFPQGNKPADMLIYEVAKGGRDPRRVLSPTQGQMIPVGHSADSKRFYVQIIIIQPVSGVPMPAPSATPPTFDDQLFEVTLETGQLRQIVALRAPLDFVSNSYQTPQSSFVIKELNGALHWALFLDRGRGTGPSGPTIKAEVTTDIGGTWPFEFPGTSWYPPHLSSDASTLDIVGFAPTPTNTSVRLADGAVTQSPASLYMASTALEKYSVGLMGVAPNVSPGTLEVRAISDKALLATLDFGALAGPPVPGAGVWTAPPKISSDGRWAAAMVTREHKSLWGPAYNGEVLVWDLSTITDSK